MQIIYLNLMGEVKKKKKERGEVYKVGIISGFNQHIKKNGTLDYESIIIS